MDEPNDKSESSSEVSFSNESSSELNPQSTAIPPTGGDGSITWTASEFVAHQKGFLWFLTLGVGAIVAAAVVYILTKDRITASAVIVAALAFAIVAAKKPKEQDYRIDRSGITIGRRRFLFDQFRSFAIVHQGAFSSLVFIPMNRFALLATAYYDPQDEEKIVAIVSSYLPMEEKKPDAIESLMWRIRF